MREFRQLAPDAVHESPTNPRCSFAETSLDELTASVRRHGVLQPILVRPNGDGFVLIAGARRLRAARLAGCATVPARVLELEDAAAEEASIIENLHREDILPLDEGVSYQRLIASGRTIEDVAAALGKSKGYVYQRISLTRLVPQVQELLARDVLPLTYALKIAVVPAEQQEDALVQCFRPLFRDEAARRDQLKPLAQLTAWVEKTVRLNPRGEDVQVLLPALAEQVVSAEQERDASVAALSTLHFHTDKADPKPILAKSWKPAEGKDRCQHARPGVIVLGEGQGTFIHVCIAKKTCEKHWACSQSVTSRPPGDEAEQTEAGDSRKRRGPSSEPRRSGGSRNSVRAPYGSSPSARRSSRGRRCCSGCCWRTSDQTTCSSMCSASPIGLLRNNSRRRSRWRSLFATAGSART